MLAGYGAADICLILNVMSEPGSMTGGGKWLKHKTVQYTNHYMGK